MGHALPRRGGARGGGGGGGGGGGRALNALPSRPCSGSFTVPKWPLGGGPTWFSYFRFTRAILQGDPIDHS